MWLKNQNKQLDNGQMTSIKNEILWFISVTDSFIANRSWEISLASCCTKKILRKEEVISKTRMLERMLNCYFRTIKETTLSYIMNVINVLKD